MKSAVLISAVLLSVAGVAAGVKPHPRLFADAARFEEVRTFCRTNEPARAFADRIVRLADAVIPEEPVRRELEGRRLLGVSRRALARILNLGFAWRFTGERKYAARALAELDAVCAFSDWHPQHYLDVGEMALAAAVAYDWFYDVIPADRRTAHARAIARLSLETWLPEDGESGRQKARTLWWRESDSNWNAVCNAGTMAACWALWDDPAEGGLARKVFAWSRQSVVKGLACYRPSGAYPEGPMYWGYGTAFACLAVELVGEITGDDSELAGQPGFSLTCEYLDRMTGPKGWFYEFGDGHRRRGLEFPSFWLAHRFNRPDTLARHERDLLAWESRSDTKESGRLNALIPLWLDMAIPPKPDVKKPEFWFSGTPDVPCCTVRLPDGVWVALKGGKARAAHMHMDAGSFVYEAKGRRFVIDYGMEPYHNAEKRGIGIWDGNQDGQRWGCFRLGPEAHAVARVNGERHLVDGVARFTAFETNALPYRLTLDMSDCYRKGVRATRRYELAADGVFTVTDRFEGLAAGDRVTSQLPVAKGAYRLSNGKSAAARELTIVPSAGAEVAVSDQQSRLESWALRIEPSDRIDFSKTAGADGKAEISYTLVPPKRK